MIDIRHGQLSTDNRPLRDDPGQRLPTVAGSLLAEAYLVIIPALHRPLDELAAAGVLRNPVAGFTEGRPLIERCHRAKTKPREEEESRKAMI